MVQFAHVQLRLHQARLRCKALHTAALHVIHETLGRAGMSPLLAVKLLLEVDHLWVQCAENLAFEPGLVAMQSNFISLQARPFPSS